MMDPKASGQLTVMLAEFAALRSEALHHFTFANALVGLQFAGIGIGLTFLDAEPSLLAGLSGLSSILWLSYMDHIYSIHRIALYIASELRSSIESVVDVPVLAWERWFRRLRSPTGVRVGSLAIADVGSETRLGLAYPSFFFCGSASFYLAFSIFHSWSSAGWSIMGRVAAIMLACLLLVFAARQYRRLARFTRSIDQVLIVPTEASLEQRDNE